VLVLISERILLNSWVSPPARIPMEMSLSCAISDCSVEKSRADISLERISSSISLLDKPWRLDPIKYPSSDRRYPMLITSKTRKKSPTKSDEFGKNVRNCSIPLTIRSKIEIIRMLWKILFPIVMNSLYMRKKTGSEATAQVKTKKSLKEGVSYTPSGMIRIKMIKKPIKEKLKILSRSPGRILER
jgi:hypothetical protein